jgi:glutathione S-transferase
MKLVIGNKNYSSWSLRAWIFMQHHGLVFDEIQVWLDTEEGDAVMAELPSHDRVPVLIDGDLQVWESYAICEYLGEKLNLAHVWPDDLQRRALARSVCLEMASDFVAVRTEMPMNLHRPIGAVKLSEVAQREVARIQHLWSTAESDDHLFGPFGLVDAFFMPVASRFATYAVKLESDVASAYQERLLTHPAFVQWRAEALEETQVIAGEEI